MTFDGFQLTAECATQEVRDIALAVFLKRMPTSSLTGETEKGYKSAVEQSVEIAQMYVQLRDELLKETK